MQISRRVILDAKGAPRRPKTGPARTTGRKLRASVGMTTKGRGKGKDNIKDAGTASLR